MNYEIQTSQDKKIKKLDKKFRKLLRGRNEKSTKSVL